MKSEKNQNKKPASVGKAVKWIVLIAVGLVLVLGILDVALALGTIHRWTHPEKTVWEISPAEHGLDYYTFEIETENGTVCGWKIAAQTPNSPDAEDWVYATEYSDKTLILAPNYDNNREITDLGGVAYLAELCATGYNIITFDWTGSGYSDGKTNVFTLDKVEELKAVVKFAAEETQASFLAVQGIGFSSYPVAMAAAECDEVDAVIFDSCYDNFESTLFSRFGDWSQWNIAPVRETVRGLFPLLSGIDLGEISLSRPIETMSGKYAYFIQGKSDEVFGSQDASRLSAIASKDNEAELWLLDDVGHLRAASYDSETYRGKITQFLEKAYNKTHKV